MSCLSCENDLLSNEDRNSQTQFLNENIFFIVALKSMCSLWQSGKNLDEHSCFQSSIFGGLKLVCPVAKCFFACFSLRMNLGYNCPYCPGIHYILHTGYAFMIVILHFLVENSYAMCKQGFLSKIWSCWLKYAFQNKLHDKFTNPAIKGEIFLKAEHP